MRDGICRRQVGDTEGVGFDGQDLPGCIPQLELKQQHAASGVSGWVQIKPGHGNVGIRSEIDGPFVVLVWHFQRG